MKIVEDQLIIKTIQIKNLAKENQDLLMKISNLTLKIENEDKEKEFKKKSYYLLEKQSQKYTTKLNFDKQNIPAFKEKIFSLLKSLKKENYNLKLFISENIEKNKKFIYEKLNSLLLMNENEKKKNYYTKEFVLNMFNERSKSHLKTNSINFFSFNESSEIKKINIKNEEKKLKENNNKFYQKSFIKKLNSNKINQEEKRRIKSYLIQDLSKSTKMTSPSEIYFNNKKL